MKHLAHLLPARNRRGSGRWWLLAAVVVSLGLSPPPSLGGVPGIAGAVRYYSNDAVVPGVAVQLRGPVQAVLQTDGTGAYAFADLDAANWEVEPAKSGDTRGAVSALDATQVLQAVVGIRQFTAVQVLACDVTGDGTVSALDAARILQFIAGTRSRLPVADLCGSDWVFVPDPSQGGFQRLVVPGLGAPCPPGLIAFEPLAPPAMGQDFRALVFGDCTGNWQPENPLPTATLPPATPTGTPPSTGTATATASATPPATATGTPTRTGTPPPTSTATAIPSATGTATRTPTATRTNTPSVTATATRTLTYTRTATLTPSLTATATPTRTGSATPTPIPTWTGTPTRTGTRTATPTLTFTTSPTPTATCAEGLGWELSPATLVSAQSGGELWLAKAVATDVGWGVFWLRGDPGASGVARLYYAHVDFSGQVTVGPLLVISIPRIDFRGRYYLAAWQQDHYGMLISNRETLYYYNLSLDGVPSGGKVVGPPLFVSPEYDQESDGDLDAYPNGFLGVIEGECLGHSCSYAFTLDPTGNPTSPPINLVDYDFTHQFYPRGAFDGAGFAILSVKDIDITEGGVTTKYLPIGGSLSANAKVVPAKQYQWDEFPDVAWNGDHYGAVWTENSGRSWSSPWQIHFASFRRSRTASTLIAERVLDVQYPKTGHRWTTQIHALGADWAAQYASRDATGALVAVYELLDSAGTTRAELRPFELNADALGSSPHFVAGHAGELGIARGLYTPNGTEVTFYVLGAAACQ